MTRTPKYLLAKYIPDLRRGEPHNIGVIVWSPEGVEARFLAEKDGQKGEVDGRSAPSFVTSLAAYKQWVRYWRNEVEKSEVVPANGGEPVPQSSPEVLEALKGANKGNFALVDGGFLLDEVNAEQLPGLTRYLFSTLVDTNGQDEPRDLTLDEVCDELLRSARLTESRNFHNRFPVKCSVAAGTEEEYVFSHAYKNGALERLYQRVSIPKRGKTFWKKNVHDAAWSFEKVIAAEIIAAEKTAALVYVTDEQKAESDVDNLLRVLGSVTKVINLQDQQTALQEFHQLSSLH